MPRRKPVETKGYDAAIALLRARRLELGISQRALGEALGVSDFLVAKWECKLRLASGYFFTLWMEALGCELIVTVNNNLPLAPVIRKLCVEAKK